MADVPTPKQIRALPDDNPKTKFGMAKPSPHLIPDPAMLMVAAAFGDGAAKYGEANWRTKAVSASIYVSAARRHIAAWYNGETNAQDSGVHHLAHAAACLMILLDAEFVGKLNDNRPPAADLQSLVDRLTKKDA